MKQSEGKSSAVIGACAIGLRFSVANSTAATGSAGIHAQARCTGQCLSSRRYMLPPHPASSKSLFQPASAFAEMPAEVPHPRQCSCEPQRARRIGAIKDQPAQRRTKIVVFRLQLSELWFALCAGQLRLGLFRERGEMIRVPLPNIV